MNIFLSRTERRGSDRTEVVFPVEYPLKSLFGETIDISETGARIKFRERLAAGPAGIILNSTTPSLLELKIKTAWTRLINEGVLFGVRFLDFTDEGRDNLKEGLIRYKFIDTNFIGLTLEIRNFLQNIKADIDRFDKKNPTLSEQVRFIERNRHQIFNTLNRYFNKVWEIIKYLDRKTYDIYQHYFYQMLEPLLGRGMEINSHIYKKPLGYPGDFTVMNYILNYHSGRYLGDSTYQKLINHYTCNIPISRANVKRKDFFKQKIQEVLKARDCGRILSIGSGPVRELIELVEEGKIDRSLFFKCMDFEERTLNYIKDELMRIEENKKQFLKIEFICRNIPALIKDKRLKDDVGKQDLVYSSGLFDYLTDRLAARFIQILYSLLDKDGRLIVCNASLRHSAVRPYYELLGDWVFYHRTKEELLEWVKDIKTSREVKFEEPADGECYLYLQLKRG